MQARQHALFGPTLLDPVDFQPKLDPLDPALLARFDEIPSEHLHEEDWKHVFSGRWKRHENILRTEWRALLWGARHIARSSKNFHHRHVLLTDNLALALAITKGRGNSKHESSAERLYPVVRGQHKRENVNPLSV